MKFYVCAHCGNIIAFMKSTGVPVMCCGQKMDELVPGTTDGALEKHVPVIAADGANITVSVGAVEHPMVEAHYIQWVVLETQKGWQVCNLKPQDKPQAVFTVAPGDQAVAAYAYCNLHGLWMAKA